MMNTVERARYDVETLTERILASELIYGPGTHAFPSRPELRARLAAAQAIVTESETTRIKWTTDMFTDMGGGEYVGRYTATGRTSTGDRWYAAIFRPPTSWPVASNDSWGLYVEVDGKTIKKGLGTVATMKVATRRILHER
jgi:hypothetical protein